MENMTCGSDWFILIWQTQCSVCFDVGTFNMLTPPPILLLSEAQMIKRNVYSPYTSSDITLDDITDISSRQGLPKMNSSLNWDLWMEVDVLDANIIIKMSEASIKALWWAVDIWGLTEARPRRRYKGRVGRGICVVMVQEHGQSTNVKTIAFVLLTLSLHSEAANIRPSKVGVFHSHYLLIILLYIYTIDR